MTDKRDASAPASCSGAAGRIVSKCSSRTRADRPGGRRDLGHWTVPKGEIEPGEERMDVARREFLEETGHAVPAGPLIELGQIRQKSGKVVLAWAVRGISIRRRPSATRLTWNGRPAPAGCSRFPRSTGWSGSTSTRRRSG